MKGIKGFAFGLIGITGLLVVLMSGCKKDDPPLFADFDGNSYDTVTIGSQLWLKGNLRTTHFLNGDPIPEITDPAAWGTQSSGAYCNYDNDQGNVETNGRIYNWYSVTDARKLCPAGSHIPSRDEWQTLTASLGGIYSAPKKMLDMGLTTLSGIRNLNGNYENLGTYGLWWTPLQNSASEASPVFMNKDYFNASYTVTDKRVGYSVLCLAD